MEGLNTINNQEVVKTAEAPVRVEVSPSHTAEQVISTMFSAKMDPRNIESIIKEKMTVERSAERN